MGSVITLKAGSELTIKCNVWGTDILLQAEILRFRFGKDNAFIPVLAEAPRPESMDASYELTEILETDTVYYARITQEPLDWPAMAWSSPIWVGPGKAGQ